jgi:hypothetical protein
MLLEAGADAAAVDKVGTGLYISCPAVSRFTVLIFFRVSRLGFQG